ncbi:MAG: DNA-binding protein [Proteobacteria bacterium]|nr:DNA-binding protein [Pseudomonadota bacterium]
MKKLLMLLGAVATLCFLGIGAAWAQQAMPHMGHGGWGQGMPYSRMFDPRTIETITGEVVSVDKIMPMHGMSYGVHAVVKTSKETISVHLGPDWYMENQNVKLAPKDVVEITGSRITFDGKPAIIATEVKKGDAVLKLRDANGVPAWSGRRRR